MCTRELNSCRVYDMTNTTRTLTEEDQDAITELLLGRRVVRAEGNELELDNGTIIQADGHEGGCSCSAGDYWLEKLNRVDNAITRVEFDYHPGGDYPLPYNYMTNEYEPIKSAADHPDNPPADSYEGFYRIFVYAENEQINLVQFNGSDGNGYYGTGFYLNVRVPE